MPFKLKNLLPTIYRDNEDLEKFLQVIEGEFGEIAEEQQTFSDRLMPRMTPDTWIRWLFYALGGDRYYRADFTETQARVVLSRLWDLYKERGTVKGMALHCNLLSGGRFIRMDNTPDKCFLGDELSEADREVFERLQPEVRIYEYRNKGEKKTFFCGDCLSGEIEEGEETKRHLVFPAVTDAVERMRDRIELYDPIQEGYALLNDFHIVGDYRWKRLQNIVEVRKRGKAAGVFLDDGFATGYTVDHGAGERLYTIQVEGPYRTEIEKRIMLSIKPSLQPVRTYFAEERIPGERGETVFLGNRWPGEPYPERGGSTIGGYLASSDAYMRIYRRTKLFDPERVTWPERQGRQFLGAFRIGAIPPFHSELFVDLRSKKVPRSIYLEEYCHGHAIPSTAGYRIETARWGGNLNRPAGTKVPMSVKNWDVVRAGETVFSGMYTTGEHVLTVERMDRIRAATFEDKFVPEPHKTTEHLEGAMLAYLEKRLVEELGKERVEALLNLAETMRGELLKALLSAYGN